MDLYIGLAATAVLLVEQILKSIPAPFFDLANKYSVATNVVLSILASIFITPVVWDLTNWRAVLVNVGSISLVAGLAFVTLVKNSGLRKLEKTQQPAPTT